ncbi:MAG TPA: DUF3047 domain-containing protein [Burkholderiales bacterium]
MNAGPIAGALLAAGLAGCAAFAPVDELTWSAELAKTLPLEEGAQVEAAYFSRLRAGAADLGGWEQFAVLKGNVPTRYHLVEIDGTVAIQADSAEGGSGMIRRVHFDPRRYPVIEFRWRVPRDSARGGASGPSRASPPVRISLAFDGDPAKLDFDDRAKLRLAKALTVNGLPYASLLYVWMNNHPAETIYSSPHTERVRHIVVESGEQRADQWIVVRRNIVEDYRRAFKEEPGDVVALGLMTDYGDNGAPRRAYYGDITFRSQ